MTRNHRRVGPGRRCWLSLPLVAGVALFASAGPASAEETTAGSGAGVGFSTISVAGGPPAAPLCLTATGGSYVVNVAAGSVVAASTAPPAAAEYAGTLQVTISISGSFDFSPAGVFAPDSNCVGAPALIPASIAVTGPTPVGPGISSVSCPADGGFFSRVNTTIAFTEAALPLDGSCTVTGPTGTVAASPVTHDFVGNEYPCFEDPITMVYTCPGALETTHVQGTWTVAGAG